MFAGVVAAAVSLGAATAAVSDASAAWFPDDKLVTVSESAYGKSGLNPSLYALRTSRTKKYSKALRAEKTQPLPFSLSTTI